MARTRTFERMISGITRSPGSFRIRILLAPGQDDVHVVVGQDEAAGAGLRRNLGRDRAHSLGRIAAMNPDPLALISFGSRIGSPAMKGERAIEPVISLVASGRSLLADEGIARRGCRPGLPLHVVRRDRLAEANVRLWPREHRRSVAARPAREVGPCCPIHLRDRQRHRQRQERWSGRQCVPYSYASLSTLRRDASAAVTGVDQLFVKAWLMRRI